MRRLRGLDEQVNKIALKGGKSMGGSSEAIDCPRCGGKETLESSIDRTDVSGCCLECGYSYHTAHEMMTLEEVNTERGEFNLEPLTELKPCVGNWIDVPDPVVPVSTSTTVKATTEL